MYRCRTVTVCVYKHQVFFSGFSLCLLCLQTYLIDSFGGASWWLPGPNPIQMESLCLGFRWISLVSSHNPLTWMLRLIGKYPNSPYIQYVCVLDEAIMQHHWAGKITAGLMTILFCYFTFFFALEDVTKVWPWQVRLSSLRGAYMTV